MRMGKKFSITQSSEYGRFMIASQDISPGEIILDELPLISGPVFTGNLDHHYPTSKINAHVCPVCCVTFHPNTAHEDTRCTKCRLLCCSTNCTENTSHSSQECLILQKLPEPEAPHGCPAVMYQFINIIRGAFLRLKGGHEWTQMSQLQGKVEELSKAGVFSPYDSLFHNLRWEFFLESNCSSQSDIPEESIDSVARQCLGIMRTNAFSCITNQVSREGLYFLSSLMAHSCLPNTDRQFESNGLKMITRAASHIPKGEPITTSYLSLMNGTHERYFETIRTWLFLCRCSRCEDPGEHGTFMSTVACPKCAKLSLQPHVKESSESTLKWKCSNVGECTFVFVSPNSSSSDAFFPDSLRIVENAKAKINLKEDIECVEKWLDTYDNGNFIHTNHSTFAQVKLYLCQFYGREKELGELEHKRLLRKASYCLQMSEIMAIVFKGFFLLKGVILFELWCSMKEIKRRVDQEALMSSPERDLVSPQSLRCNVQINCRTDEINRTKAESLRILQYAMENSAEESMARIMLAEDD